MMDKIIEVVTFFIFSLTILISLRPRKIIDNLGIENLYKFHMGMGIATVISVNILLSQQIGDYFYFPKIITFCFILVIFSGIFGLSNIILNHFPKLLSRRDKKIKRTFILWLHRTALLIYAFLYLNLLTISIKQYDIFIALLLSVFFFITIGSYIHYILIKKKENTLRLIANEKIADNVQKITLFSKDSKEKFTGSYGFIKVKSNEFSSESHPFSVIVDEQNNSMDLLIKNAGDYTKEIKNIALDSQIYVEGPYENIKSLSRDQAVIFLFGGIGVTTFFSNFNRVMQENQQRPIHLLWSVSHENDLFYEEKLKEMTHENPHFSFDIFITRDDSTKYIASHLSKEHIKALCFDLLESNPKFIVSGSYGFSKYVKKELSTMKIKQQEILTTSFMF